MKNAYTMWTGRFGDRIPVGAKFSVPVQTGPGAHPASCTIGTGSFPGIKSSRGVTLTPNLLLVPWSRKSRAIPLVLLWAIRSVQSLSACTSVHFTFTLPIPYIPIAERTVLYLILEFKRVDEWTEVVSTPGFVSAS
jgi:hypothetical protein